jgi:hypothetical protein
MAHFDFNTGFKVVVEKLKVIAVSVVFSES